MTKDTDDIPAADQSLEGMINEAFGTVRFVFEFDYFDCSLDLLVISNI